LTIVGKIFLILLACGLFWGIFAVATSQENSPQISDIDFPSTIQADGKSVTGLIFFEDPDGDVVKVKFELVEGDRSSLQLSPGWEFDPQVKGQTEGVIEFQVAATAGGHFKLQATLEDEAGNTSAPLEFGFEAIAMAATLRVPLDYFTIEEALEAAQPGDIILISPGLYGLNLVIDKSITLKGESTGVILQGQDKGKPVLTVQGEGVQVKLETLKVTALAGARASAVLVQEGAQLTIVNAPVDNQGAAAALEVAKSGQLTVEATAVHSEGGTALQGRDAGQIALSNAELTGKKGIALTGSAQANLTDCTVTATDGDALTFSGSGDLTLTGSTVAATEGDGLSFESSGELNLQNVKITATGNGLSFSGSGILSLSNAQITAKGAGLTIRRAAQATLSGLTIQAEGNGLSFSSESGGLSLDDVEIETTGTGGDGLSFESSGELNLQHVRITATGDGLSFAGSGGLSLSDVRITAGAAAMRLSGSAQVTLDLTKLTDLTLSGEEAVIALRGAAKLTLRGGPIEAGERGIGVDVAETAELTLEEAAVTGGALNLRVIDRGRAKVLRSTLSGGSVGVLAGDSALLVLIGNRITDHRFWGVALAQPSCGYVHWKFKTGYEVDSSPAIGEDGTIYVGSGDNYLYAINPDGTLRWKFKTGDFVLSSPTIGKDGTVYVGSWDDYLYAIGPLYGQIHGFLTGVAPEFTGTVTGSDNVMQRNGTELIPGLREAAGGQGNVCPAGLLFLVKQGG